MEVEKKVEISICESSSGGGESAILKMMQASRAANSKY
jgi:hypothetical protein